jgi:flavin-dependent dehydrogenase
MINLSKPGAWFLISRWGDMKAPTKRRVAGQHIVVIGGGPAGIATALALLEDGYRVTVVERSRYDAIRVGEHLSPNAVPYLARLNVLELVKQGGHHPCVGIQSAWGAFDLVDQDYIFNPYGNGFNLSRPTFDQALADEAVRRGAAVLTGTRLEPPVRMDHGWSLTVCHGPKRRPLQADFLVDATGRSAWLARALQSERMAHDKLVGMVGYMVPKTAVGAQVHRLLVEACEDGWWYSTPLADGRIVAAYMTDADIAAKSPGRPLTFWRQRLDASHHTKARTAAFEITGEVRIRPAWSQTLSTVAGTNWLTVGDAALSFDPLSSAGIAKGLKWGIGAAAVIRRQLDGERGVCTIYQREVYTAFNDYLRTQATYYRMEARWPQSTFWRRRHIGSPTLSNGHEGL